MSQSHLRGQLTPINFTAVTIADNFWAPRLETNRSVTVPYELKQCEETGRIDNFAKAGRLMDGKFEGIFFNDSDVYKWIEAASYALATHPDETLEAKLDAVIARIASAQEADGYLNTYFTLVEPNKKWQNLGMMHELYCAGHLIEGAIAHYHATGRRTLLDVACKLADKIDSVFGTGKRNGLPGHEEIELALVGLYRVTGERRYLDLAQFFLDERGQSPSPFEKELENPDLPGSLDAYRHHMTRNGTYDGSYSQDHLPVRQQTACVGHAVRAMYLYCGMADVARETGEQALIDALERLWENVTLKRMYITGGIGPSGHNEGFTADYDLPNTSAYAETCAAVGLVFWSHRMLMLHGESRFADVMETALYNGALAGISLDGEKFFYQNPLASEGNRQRQGWFSCACCPPNIARLLASLGQYIYARSEGGLWVNLYVAGTATAELGNGLTVKLKQETNHPWTGDVKLTLHPDRQTPFDLNLRVPGWSDRPQVKINGRPYTTWSFTQGYMQIRRGWTPGDVVELAMPMEIQRIHAHPFVRENVGRIALRRGPLIYCFEETDNPGLFHTFSLSASEPMTCTFEPNRLRGVTVIRAKGREILAADWENQLYRTAPPKSKPVDLIAIPYYAWCNREIGKMAVWMRGD